MTKRLLYISPYFPPLTNVGVKRAVNFAEWLPSFGWEIVILASPPYSVSESKKFSGSNSVKVFYEFESKLLRPWVKFFKGLSKKRKVTAKQKNKAKPKNKKEVSYTPLDQYMWDIPGAVKYGKKLINEFKPHVILVNADPWSGLMVGHLLHKWSGVPWVADFRDPWTAFEERMESRPAIIRKIIISLEKKFFDSADKVILNTRNCFNEYRRRYPVTIGKKLLFIRNAFDVKQLGNASETKSQGLFKFGYFGSFRTYVSSQIVLESFAEFINNSSLSPESVCFEIYGDVDKDFDYHLIRLGLSDYINVNRSVSIDNTLRTLRSFDALVLVVSPLYKLMIPAKLYDYLAARKPILAISNNDEVNNIIEETQSGRVASYGDINQIESLFNFYFNNRNSGLLENSGLIKAYSVQQQVEMLNTVLSKICS
ncbi:MAG: glycosyltransferase [Bacteroidota bacterium]